MIKWAYNNSYRVFDFGIARYEGQKRFKAKWGTIFHDYSYYFYPRNVDFLKRKIYAEQTILNKLWSKYIPYRLARIIGPIVRRRLGK